ncbi:MAG: DUF456 domain-containing protein [Paludibacteraceae bacterium]|nr:DUF456 domain-containing protein [Paludibacteraceae bacterium]
MDIVLVIASFVFLIIGLLGSVLPVLPGIPLSYVGLLLLHFSSYADFSTTFLLLWLVVVVVLQVLDYYLPIWGTKKWGGTKWGMWGSTIGLLFGFFLGPLGVIFGPFVGAVVGELINGAETSKALKSGFGSFVGFLVGTIAKLAIGGLFIYYCVKALF